MSEQAKRMSDFTPFEAALAGLAPRVEGFDRERLIFLAGQAAALRDRGAGVSPAEKRAGDCPDFYRGPAQRGGKNGTVPFAGRWRWPAAFAAMTAVAATLLVMLCIRPATTVATSEPKSAVARENVSGTGHPPAGRVPDTVDDAAPLESDPVFRAELRSHGIDFDRPRLASGFPGASVGREVVAEGPMTYYELLRRLQKQAPAGQGGAEEMMQ